MKLMDIISVDFNTTVQLLIRYSAFIRYWRKNGSIVEEYINYLHFKICNSIRREVLYNILWIWYTYETAWAN